MVARRIPPVEAHRHRVGQHAALLETQDFGVKAVRRLDVADVQHQVVDAGTDGCPGGRCRHRGLRIAGGKDPAMVVRPVRAEYQEPGDVARRTASQIALWCQRRLEVADAEVSDGVDDRVVDRRDGPDGAGLPDSLGPERVDERRRLHVHEVERRQLDRRDDRVVGERGGLRLPVGVVVDPLEQRLGHALGDAAVHLPLRQQRVDQPPGVVDGDELTEPHPSGLGVDLDHGHVGAERERRHQRVKIVLGGERSAIVGDEVGPADAASRCTGDVEAARRRARRRRRLPRGRPPHGAERRRRAQPPPHRPPRRPTAPHAIPRTGRRSARGPCRRGRHRSARSGHPWRRRRSSPTSCHGLGRSAWPRCARAALRPGAPRPTRTRRPARRP